MCAEYNVPHVVNNAYGVQSSKCLHLIEEVCARACVCVCVRACVRVCNYYRLSVNVLMHPGRVLYVISASW